MIAYRRQEDGTYRKEGEFAAAPSEVRIKVGDAKPFSGSYTLAQATAIIEDAIAKGQVNKEVYYILPMEEPAAKAPKPGKYDSLVTTDEQNARITAIQEKTGGSRSDAIKQMLKEDKDAAKATAKAEKTAAREAKKAERAAAKAAQPKTPKTPKAKKYSNDDFVRIYQETFAITNDSSKSLDAVCEQTKASRVWAQRVLNRLGVWVKQTREKVAKPEVVLTEQEEARVTEIMATNAELSRKQAIQKLRREVKAASKSPKAPKKSKYSQDDFVRIYQESGNSLEAVLIQTGASRVWTQRVLVRRGVWVKPVKPVIVAAAQDAANAAAVAAMPTPEPAPEPAPSPAPAPVEEAKPKAAKKGSSKKASKK